MGYVKTAFLQGDVGENERQIYGDPPPDARRLLCLSHDDLLKLERSVYGLRTAPKSLVCKGRRRHEENWRRATSSRPDNIHVIRDR
eukprot:5288695-Lingulodinium_polyedra.AAC.1